ncbi:MAG: hypothetical protein COU71_01725 [Parcubacteria group bacterium CG10_big_fil_rev_8_21_14_0_10_38_31]|nr:MAG: hypothetical protein COU71_01725 [Parcubacteria group bacterium CG10_big_fil_rev_8_21_14_0_10_38_31]
MGEIINFDFNKRQSKDGEKTPAQEEATNVIDFKEHSEKKKESMQLKEGLENIIKESSKNEDGTYAIKFDLKLKNNKREILTDYLISKGIHFYSVDNKMGPTESDVGLDLDIDEDEIQNLLEFFKEKDIEYTHIK